MLISPAKIAHTYAFVLFGSVTLYAFFRYERLVASQPILPQRLLRDSTILAGCSLGFFHFCCQFTYESYFSSYLQVRCLECLVTSFPHLSLGMLKKEVGN
jgi:hypothetical protein